MRKHILLSLFIILLTSCSIFSPGREQRVSMVIVGCDYSSLSNGISFGTEHFYVPSLEGTVGDAKETGAALFSLYKERNIPCEVSFMVAEGNTPLYSDSLHPTKDKILERLKALKMDKDNLVIFYFAGHGYYDGTDLYLICAENGEEEENTALKGEELLSALQSLECRSAVILDCCYSGAMDPENGGGEYSFLESIASLFNYDSLPSLDKISLISAARKDEESFEASTSIPYEKHGYFTNHLLEALGWEHSSEKECGIANSNGRIIRARGFSQGVRETLTMDDIYKRIELGLRSDDIPQHPVFYYSREIIKLIP